MMTFGAIKRVVWPLAGLWGWFVSFVGLAPKMGLRGWIAFTVALALLIWWTVAWSGDGEA